MSDNNMLSMIEKYRKITGVNEDIAKKHLASCNWNYERTLELYHGHTEEKEEHSVSNSSVHPKEPESSGHVSRSEETDQRDRPSFYVGGSVTSGQLVLDPEHQDIAMSDISLSSGSRGDPIEVQNLPFTGIGHVLGSTEDCTNVEDDIPRPEIEMRITFWRNGFMINEGPLKDYDDPQNRELLEAIQRGEAPPELVGEYNRDHISVTIRNVSQEDYIPPKREPQFKAFSGKGQKLEQSSSPLDVKSDLMNEISPEKADAQDVINLDPSKPTTTIQIRLTDGSRLTMEVNYHHTVRDIRRYVLAARPKYNFETFSLMTAFPSRELTDENVTVQEANLLNSLVILKLTS